MDRYKVAEMKLDMLVRRQNANFFKSSLLDQKIGYIKGVLDTCDALGTRVIPHTVLLTISKL